MNGWNFFHPSPIIFVLAQYTLEGTSEAPTVKTFAYNRILLYFDRIII